MDQSANWGINARTFAWWIVSNSLAAIAWAASIYYFGSIRFFDDGPVVAGSLSEQGAAVMGIASLLLATLIPWLALRKIFPQIWWPVWLLVYLGHVAIRLISFWVLLGIMQRLSISHTSFGVLVPLSYAASCAGFCVALLFNGLPPLDAMKVWAGFIVAWFFFFLPMYIGEKLSLVHWSDPFRRNAMDLTISQSIEFLVGSSANWLLPVILGGCLFAVVSGLSIWWASPQPQMESAH